MFCRWVKEGLGHGSGGINTIKQNREEQIKDWDEGCLRWEGELDRLRVIASAEGVWGTGLQTRFGVEGGKR